MCWSQSAQMGTPGVKKVGVLDTEEVGPRVEQTVIKNCQVGKDNGCGSSGYDQMKTPVGGGGIVNWQGRKGIVFFGSGHEKYMFPLYRDQEIGIRGELQRRVHSTHHDDDRMTTTTQLGLAISQTCEDLFEVLQSEYGGSQGKSNSLTQTFGSDRHCF